MIIESGIAIAIGVIFSGFSSTAAYEQLNVRDRGCGDLITFCEYLLVVMFHGKYLFNSSRKVPVWTHIVVLSG